MKKAVVYLVLAAALQVGCGGAMTSWREANCDYDGAYKAGMNHARNGEDMDEHFASSCEPATRSEAERGYRDGYTAGVEAGTRDDMAGVETGTRGGESDRPWVCKEAYGKEACGYECVEAYGDIACAKQPEHNCVEAYGDVRCGPNCRDEYGDIVCDD